MSVKQHLSAYVGRRLCSVTLWSALIAHAAVGEGRVYVMRLGELSIRRRNINCYETGALKVTLCVCKLNISTIIVQNYEDFSFNSGACCTDDQVSSFACQTSALQLISY